MKGRESSSGSVLLTWWKSLNNDLSDAFCYDMLYLNIKQNEQILAARLTTNVSARLIAY